MSDEAAVAARVLDGLDALVARLGEAYAAVPEYAALPPGVMEREVLPVSRAIIEAFLEAVANGREATVTDVDVLSDMGRRRLEMGVPLEPMLHVYRIAGREVFDALAAAASDGEMAALAPIGRAWMDFIDRASSAAASSYLHASHDRLRRLDAQRGALLESLLAATDASDAAAVAAEFAVVLAHRYAPVLVAGADVTSRIDRLVAASPPETLSGFRGAQVLLLVPEPVGDLRGVAGVAPDAVVAAGRAAEPGKPLASEVRVVSAVVAAALAHDRTGVLGPDDLALEQLVGGDARLAAALRDRVVVPLRDADRGGLLESTLRTFLRTGSVPTTAREELVHANTVAYRLRRVAALTGLDPRVPEETAVLVVALLADRA